MRQTASFASLFACLGLALSSAPAQAPATTQSDQADTPREQELLWQDQYEQCTAEEVLPDYAVHSDEQLANGQYSSADALAADLTRQFTALQTPAPIH